MLCLACTSEKNCTIRGSVTVPADGQAYYAVLLRSREGLDTCRIGNGRFTLRAEQNPQCQLHIEIQNDRFEWIGDGSIFDKTMEIIPDTREIQVDMDASQSTGSPLTDSLNQLLRQIFNLLEGPGPETDEMMAAHEAGDMEKIEEIRRRTTEKMQQILRETYQGHLNDAVGLQALRLLSNFLETDELKELMAKAAGFIQEDESLLTTLRWQETMNKETGEVEYVRLEKNGSILSRETMDALACLNTIVGQGNYVLLDFWASWCAPFREEIPHVIKLHEKYAGKGLKVVGVTVNDKAEHSLAAMQELGINYDQIFDLEGIICSKYPVQGIPHFFLLDPGGAVVLSGHHNLDEFDAYLKKNL